MKQPKPKVKKESKAGATRAGRADRSPEHPPYLLKQFSFTGWGFEMPEAETAERKARLEEEMAEISEREGFPDSAQESRATAAQWRKLAALSEAEAIPCCERYREEATDYIDALLIRAETGKSENAAFYLFEILFKAQQALYSLAAHGSQRAGLFFANALAEGINNFESLAGHKPEIFRQWARKAMGIPGMISRNKEKSEDNQRICRELQQGEDCETKILPAGKKGWKFATPANALAERLKNHIQSARSLYVIHRMQADQSGRVLPAWLDEAMRLKPFSAQTWEAWAKVAWLVLAEISPDGRPEYNRAFYDPETQICNVRKSRTEESHSLKAEWNAARVTRKSDSIPAQDIKEALFGAFRLIATGESVRTKQRKKKKV